MAVSILRSLKFAVRSYDGDENVFAQRVMMSVFHKTTNMPSHKLSYALPTKHKPWANSRAVQSVPWVKECSDVRVFPFPDEAGSRESPSQDRRRRARTLPIHLPSPDDTP